MSVNIGIELKAGYVIDLSERDEPGARIVDGVVKTPARQVIDHEAEQDAKTE